MNYEITHKDLEYVQKIIHKVFNVSKENVLYDDMVSIGNEALLKAVRKYDKSRGASLQTLIYSYVVWGVRKFLRKKYAKNFSLKIEAPPKEELMANSVEWFENLEQIKEALNVIKTFPEKHVLVFSEWLLGTPRTVISKKYEITPVYVNWVTKRILDEVHKCLET